VTKVFFYSRLIINQKTKKQKKDYYPKKKEKMINLPWFVRWGVDVGLFFVPAYAFASMQDNIPYQLKN
jgi:hypothetical protein